MALLKPLTLLLRIFLILLNRRSTSALPDRSESLKKKQMPDSAVLDERKKDLPDSKKSKKRYKSPTTQYDHLFRSEGSGLPLYFLRALAKNESAMNPNEKSGPAWGILQVGIDRRAGNVLKGYNSRKGTAYTKADMLNPKLNIRVATELLRRIVFMYEGEGIRQDWKNPNYTALVVAGWNSGYSIKAGTVKVIRFLKSRGLPVTHENVFRYSQDAGATKHLSSSKKLRWQRKVAEDTLREQGIDPSPIGGKTTWLPIALLLTLFLLR